MAFGYGYDITYHQQQSIGYNSRVSVDIRAALKYNCIEVSDNFDLTINGTVINIKYTAGFYNDTRLEIKLDKSFEHDGQVIDQLVCLSDHVTLLQNQCKHQWVDTGLKKTWCKHCDTEGYYDNGNVIEE